MTILKSLTVLLFVVGCLTPSFAEDNAGGLPVWIGDSSQQVKDAYQTQLEPEPVATAAIKGTTQLRLKTKGVWFFFNREDKIYSIRIEAPFPNAIRGVKIGDSVTKLVKTMGKPAKVTKPGMGIAAGLLPRTYTYYLDDVTTANILVNADDEVEIVFLTK
jgi:hypothetical protein